MKSSDIPDDEPPPAPNCRCTLPNMAVDWLTDLLEMLDEYIGDTEPWCGVFDEQDVEDALTNMTTIIIHLPS